MQNVWGKRITSQRPVWDGDFLPFTSSGWHFNISQIVIYLQDSFLTVWKLEVYDQVLRPHLSVGGESVEGWREGRREGLDVSFPKDNPILLWNFDYCLRFHLQMELYLEVKMSTSSLQGDRIWPVHKNAVQFYLWPHNNQRLPCLHLLCEWVFLGKSQKTWLPWKAALCQGSPNPLPSLLITSKTFSFFQSDCLSSDSPKPFSHA